MDRHTKLLKEFSRSKTQAELLNKLSKSRKAIILVTQELLATG